MWHSETDIMNDLAALNDFGDPGNTQPYKILCSIGRGSKTKPKPEKFLDSRTGDEIESSDDSMKMEDVLHRGRGRGSVLGTRNYFLLRKQLRLARPLGSGDEIIESYYPKNTSPKENLPCSNPEHTIAPQDCSDKSCALSSSKVSHRIKGVRSANMLNNALIASLLKAKQISLVEEKSNVANELGPVEEGNGAMGSKSADVTKSANSEASFASDESVNSPASEDPSLVSTRVCSESCTKEEISGEMKDSGDKRPKSFFGFDLTKNFYKNIDFIGKEDNRMGVGKNKTGIGAGSSDRDNTDERGDIDEQYKKLGESLNRIEIYNKRRKERERGSESSSFQRGSASQWTQEHLTVVGEEFHFDISNFPPLVNKN